MQSTNLKNTKRTTKIIHSLITRLRPHGKHAFVRTVASGAKVLDVGCGNSSAQIVKYAQTNCHYTGIDVADYNLSNASKDLIDVYVISPPHKFGQSIRNLHGLFDVIISSHNLEHTNDRDDVLRSMVDKVADCGVMYLSFPCSASKSYPSRYGTLNYYDDDTHKYEPPDPNCIIKILEDKGFKIIYYKEKYQPIILRIIGFLLEPISILMCKVLPGTWEYHGFETIIHAKKVNILEHRK